MPEEVGEAGEWCHLRELYANTQNARQLKDELLQPISKNENKRSDAAIHSANHVYRPRCQLRPRHALLAPISRNVLENGEKDNMAKRKLKSIGQMQEDEHRGQAV
jgi:hypothetical protein